MIEQQVHTKVTADAGQANAEMTKFKKAVDDIGGAGVSLGTKLARGLDGAAVALGKFNLALGGVQQIVGFIHTGMDALRDVDAFHKLERAVPVKTFEALDEATDRLYKKTDLLRFSTKALNSDFKFSTAQMADLLGAATTLSEQGYEPMNQIAEKLIKSVAKNGEGLDEYGIILDKTKSKTDQTTEALSKLHALAGQGLPSDETRAIAEMDRSFEELSMTLKEDLVPILVAVVELIHDTITGWDDMLGGLEKKRARAAQRVAEENLARSRTGAEFVSDLADARDAGSEADYLRIRGYQTMGDADYANAVTAGLGTPQRSNIRGGPGKSSGSIPVYVVNAAEVGGHDVDPFSPTADTDFGGAAWDSGALDDLERRQEMPFRNAAWKKRNPLSGLNIGGESFQGNADLAGRADELHDLKQALNDTSTAAGASYAALSAGLGAAVDAAITGSDSIARAAARASSGVLKSLAIEATGKAGWYLVEAGAYALHGNAAQASASLVLAGEYAAKAGLLGTLAAGLNAASSSGGGGGGGGGGGRPGYGAGAAGGGYMSHGGGGGAQGINITVVVGEGFGGAAGGDVSKQVADGVSRALRQAERQGSRRNYTTATYSG